MARGGERSDLVELIRIAVAGEVPKRLTVGDDDAVGIGLGANANEAVDLVRQRVERLPIGGVDLAGVARSSRRQWTHIYAKLGVGDHAGAVATAFELGLLRTGG